MKKRSLSGILFFFICLTGLFSQEKNYSEQLITVKNGGVVQLGDVKVEIPAGALKEDTVISITRLDQVQDTGDTISNATNNLGGYRFLPAGTKFRKNVTISIPYEPSLNAKPLVLNDTYTYFYDVEKKGWIQLERKAIDNPNCIIQSYTNHFTDMINATLTMPETASPVDFNLNSIKGLEASKADAQVLNFNPPQGSNYGDAGFTLTLDILSGRNGMQPQIQIAYSSSIGNGVLGKGFDINFGSAITIDTRKKLPEYNENDIYMFDGTQLRLINKYNDCYEYELKRKTGYQIIRRYNPYSNDPDKKDYWEVISSNGVISRYGLEDNSTVGQDDKIFTWYLTKVIDQNLNFMEYKYSKDSGYVYIDDISYTGHAEESGPYHVKFEYEDRQDVRIDARSGQAVACKLRVKTIQSYYQDVSSLFREYEFKYKEGLSKSSLLEIFIVYSSDKKDSYEYSFDYYEVDGNNFFGTPTKFSSETKLDKSSSFSSGASVYASGGVGAGKDYIDFRTTGGGNKSNSSSDSELELLLIDINGDGFVDRLEKDGNTIKVYKGKTNGDGFEKNSISLNIVWNGIPKKTIKFNSQSSTSDSKSGVAYAGIYYNNSGAGYTFTATDTTSTNTSSSCFMDVDADGFVDIVIDTETYLHNDISEDTYNSNSNSIQFTACRITDFPSFTKNLSTKDKQDLSKDYLMNRPFKVWKAPYNGTVIVNNSVTSSNPNLKGNIYYKNENNAQEKKVVTSNLEISKYLKTNQDIFFVPDTGDDIPQVKNENRNKSMNWDIDIKYTSVKPFVYEGNYIFLMPASIISITVDDYTTDDHGNKTGIKSWSFSDKSIPSGLQRLYTLPTLNSTTGTTSLRSDWKNSLVSLDKSSIEYLINNKKYIPYIITYDQLESLNLNESEKQLLQQIYYYDYATNSFYLDDSRITSSNSNIISSIKDQCLNNFNIASIPVKFTVEETTIKPLYELNKSIELTDNNRFNENTTGTFDEMGSIFNIQTKVGNDFINKIIKEDDTWVLDSEKDLFKLKNVNSTTGKIEIELQDKENKYIIKLWFENNQKDNAVSVLTEQEMDYLYNKYKKTFTFNEIKNKIIEYIYNIRVADDDTLKPEDIQIEGNYLSLFFNEAIESGYINTNDINIFIEESVDQELTDAFVEKYINYYFYCKQVPAYSKSGDKWIKDSTITNLISKDTIIDELKLYSYKNYSASIVYNTESQYEIVSFGNNQNGFSILKLNEASDYIDMYYDEIVLSNQKLFSNSAQSFAATNSIEDKINYDSLIKGFKVQKSLYGGYNGWYYAIWTGTESENKFSITKIDEYLSDNVSNVPEEFFTITDDNEIWSKGNEELLEKHKEDEKAFNDNKDKTQYEILTITNKLSVFDQNNLLKANTLKEQETGIKLSNDDNGAILVGNINQKSVRNEEDNSIYFEYYFAYIKGNTINCSRTNGDSYYYIFGMPDNSSIKILTKTESLGEEKNHSISGNIGSLSGSVSYTESNTKSNMKQSFMDITGDRIPDVLIISGNKLVVYKGVLNNKELTFVKLSDDDFNIKNISSISSYENNNTGGAGSLCLGPTFVTQLSATGSLQGVTSNGFSAFNGEDKQYKGFLDINGDGIEDYVTTNGVRLGSIQGLLDTSDFTIKDDKNSIDSIYKTKVSGDNISFPFMGNLSQLDFLDNDQLVEIFELYIKYLDANNDEDLKKKLEEEINKKINGAKTNNISFDFSLSLNGSFSSTDSVIFMADINGDGLLDLIEDKGGSIKVRYNLGSRFDDNVEIIILPSWTKAPELQNNTSTDTTNQENSNETKIYNEKLQSNYTASGILSFNINVNGALKYPIFWGLMGKLLASGGTNINFNWGDSHAETKFMDMDGDGLPDAVIATDKGIFYKKNLSGQADLIKSVKIPQGGVCKIEYGYVAPSFNMPMGINVMSKVTLSDGSLDEKGKRNENLMPYVDNGDHETVVTYKYENGKYDRAEREYYGFGTLTATSENGSYTISTFNVNPGKYWLKGCLKSSQQFTVNKFLLFEENIFYPGDDEIEEILIPPVEEIALPVIEETKYYEKSNDNTYLSSKTEYKYDNYLNVTELTTKYNNDDTKKIKAEVTYLNDYENNHYSLPTEITVYGTNAQGQEELLRKRKGDYSPTGNLISLEQYYEKNKALKTILEYDNKGYGNIVKVTDPTRVSVEYEYDDLNQFVRTIKQVSSIDNSDVLVTKVEIDPKYQVKQKETDLNGNTMTYKYDNWQRLTEVYSPYDEVGNPDEACVKFEYYTPVNSFWYVITTNKVAFEDVPAGQPNYIKTIVIQDGLSRVVQTAKTGYICENPEADENSLSFKKGWNVSGSVKYDEYGRVIEQGQTYFVEGESIDTIIKENYPDNEYVIKEINVTKNLQFDERDRVTKTELPDGKSIQNEYSIEGKYLKNVVIDPKQNRTVQFTDAQGKIFRVEKQKANKELLTSVTYEYNMMGEMLKAVERGKEDLNNPAPENPVTVEYDMLGRTLSLDYVDSGKKQYYYDDSTLLQREDDSRLRNENRNISYEYDGFNRLVKIDYLNKEDTIITYGTQDNKNINAYGRVVSVQDEGTSVTYKYGKLGQVVEETRTITNFIDSHSVKEQKSATMKYQSDYLGRMQKIIYPDGEVVVYSYDYGGQVNKVTGKKTGLPDIDYVKNIGYDEQGQRNFIIFGNGVKTTYQYNKQRGWLSNINTVSHNNNNQLLQNINYEFDAVGNVKGYVNNCITGGNYSTDQTYEYDDLYQLTSVTGNTKFYETAGLSLPTSSSTYTQVFEYDQRIPGNLVKKTSTENSRNTPDSLNYDLDYTYDPNFVHRVERVGDKNFVYDASGNLILEYDGEKKENPEEDDYIIINTENNVYGTEGAWGYGSNRNGGDIPDYTNKRKYEWDDRNQLIRTVDNLYDTNYVYNNEGQRVAKYTSNTTAMSETLYFNNFWTWHYDTANAYTSYGQYSKNIYLGETRIVTRLLTEETNSVLEPERTYYYHTDHLGSASLVTNSNGEIYERLEYTPYGEVWVDICEETGLLYLPYKFSAKERDSETGLYYYGARYLDPKYSLWKSTDPALGEYIPVASTNDEWSKKNSNLPGMGGVFNPINFHLYHYAGNNPIRYTDPDGRELEVFFYNDENNQKEIKEALQKLTDDKLEIEGGKIIISEKREGKKTDGTKLIRELIKSEEVIHIVLSEESKINQYDPNDSLRGKVVTWNNKNYYNYYPIYKENAGLVREEKTNSEILLAHELIHAYHDINGTYIGDNDPNLNFEIYLCDRTKWTSNPSKEEHNTVFGPGISENSIRKELGFNIRGVY